MNSPGNQESYSRERTETAYLLRCNIGVRGLRIFGAVLVDLAALVLLIGSELGITSLVTNITISGLLAILGLTVATWRVKKVRSELQIDQLRGELRIGDRNDDGNFCLNRVHLFDNIISLSIQSSVTQEGLSILTVVDRSKIGPQELLTGTNEFLGPILRRIEYHRKKSLDFHDEYDEDDIAQTRIRAPLFLDAGVGELI